jgi:hypothetical protein
MDTVPDPLLLRKSGSAGNRNWTSGSVASNFDLATDPEALVRFSVLADFLSSSWLSMV